MNIDPTSLAAAVSALPDWPHGPVHVSRVEPIGGAFSLGEGTVYRVGASTDVGETVSFVVKEERADATERALAFHRAVAARTSGAIPRCFGGSVDRDGDRGFLVLEDVDPAEQGDVLRGCTDARADAVVRALARVHTASWGADDVHERWTARVLEPREWRDRLAAAAERFPRTLTPALAGRLETIPARVEQAVASLEAGPRCWIHTDAHLDNVLFRPDRSAVLLDWSHASIGPPGVDLARLVSEGFEATRAEPLISSYTDELDRVGTADVWRMLEDGVALVVQSSVAWAAREETREPRARIVALQENFLRGACAWFGRT